MTIYTSDDIKTIHLELTSKCNASCPMCARNVFGGKENENLPLTELSLNDIKLMFPIEFICQLSRLYLCGNYGDPIIAKDMIDILEYFKIHNPSIKLSLHTNGSARSTKWWKRLAEVLGDTGYVVFGLDGLEDTNHLYRKNTQWEKIINNINAFISNGGRAHWDYIVFKHNQHQIDDARKLSEQLGFKKFQIKKTGRFFSNSKLSGKDHQEVHDRNGNIEYIIEKPDFEEYQNKSLLKEEMLIEKYGSMENYLDQTNISCKTQEEKSLYISGEGLVFPCCWTANQMYLWYAKKTQITEYLEESGGKSTIDLKINTLENILNGKFFEKIEGSWNLPSCKLGKLKVCSKTCGQEFDQFKSQFK